MKNMISIIGILLILAGTGMFAYKRFYYTTQESVAQIGDLKVTAENQESVYFPPLLSGATVLAGVVLLAVGMRRK